MLFLRGCLALLALDLLQGGDRLDVAPKLFFRPALAQVLVQDTEVFRGGYRRGRVMLRLVEAQRADLHIKGQAVPFAGVEGRGFLMVGWLRVGRFVQESELLLLIHGPKDTGDLVP